MFYIKNNLKKKNNLKRSYTINNIENKLLNKLYNIYNYFIIEIIFVFNKTFKLF